MTETKAAKENRSQNLRSRLNVWRRVKSSETTPVHDRIAILPIDPNSGLYKFIERQSDLERGVISNSLNNLHGNLKATIRNLIGVDDELKSRIDAAFDSANLGVIFRVAQLTYSQVRKDKQRCKLTEQLSNRLESLIIPRDIDSSEYASQRQWLATKADWNQLILGVFSEPSEGADAVSAAEELLHQREETIPNS